MISTFKFFALTCRFLVSYIRNYVVDMLFSFIRNRFCFAQLSLSINFFTIMFIFCVLSACGVSLFNVIHRTFVSLLRCILNIFQIVVFRNSNCRVFYWQIVGFSGFRGCTVEEILKWQKHFFFRNLVKRPNWKFRNVILFKWILWSCFDFTKKILKNR